MVKLRNRNGRENQVEKTEKLSSGKIAKSGLNSNKESNLIMTKEKSSLSKLINGNMHCKAKSKLDKKIFGVPYVKIYNNISHENDTFYIKKFSYRMRLNKLNLRVLLDDKIVNQKAYVDLLRENLEKKLLRTSKNCNVTAVKTNVRVFAKPVKKLKKNVLILSTRSSKRCMGLGVKKNVEIESDHISDGKKEKIEVEVTDSVHHDIEPTDDEVKESPTKEQRKIIHSPISPKKKNSPNKTKDKVTPVLKKSIIKVATDTKVVNNDNSRNVMSGFKKTDVVSSTAVKKSPSRSPKRKRGRPRTRVNSVQKQRNISIVKKSPRKNTPARKNLSARFSASNESQYQEENSESEVDIRNPKQIENEWLVEDFSNVSKKKNSIKANKPTPVSRRKYFIQTDSESNDDLKLSDLEKDVPNYNEIDSSKSSKKKSIKKRSIKPIVGSKRRNTIKALQDSSDESEKEVPQQVENVNSGSEKSEVEVDKQESPRKKDILRKSLQPMPASKRRKLLESISMESDEDSVKSPEPERDINKILERSRRPSKIKKRNSLDTSLLERKSLQSEFSENDSEDNIETNDITIISSDEGSIKCSLEENYSRKSPMEYVEEYEVEGSENESEENDIEVSNRKKKVNEVHDSDSESEKNEVQSSNNKEKENEVHGSDSESEENEIHSSDSERIHNEVHGSENENEENDSKSSNSKKKVNEVHDSDSESEENEVQKADTKENEVHGSDSEENEIHSSDSERIHNELHGSEGSENEENDIKGSNSKKKVNKVLSSDSESGENEVQSTDNNKKENEVHGSDSESEENEIHSSDSERIHNEVHCSDREENQALASDKEKEVNQALASEKQKEVNEVHTSNIVREENEVHGTDIVGEENEVHGSDSETEKQREVDSSDSEGEEVEVSSSESKKKENEVHVSDKAREENEVHGSDNDAEENHEHGCESKIEENGEHELENDEIEESSTGKNDKNVTIKENQVSVENAVANIEEDVNDQLIENAKGESGDKKSEDIETDKEDVDEAMEANTSKDSLEDQNEVEAKSDKKMCTSTKNIKNLESEQEIVEDNDTLEEKNAADEEHNPQETTPEEEIISNDIEDSNKERNNDVQQVTDKILETVVKDTKTKNTTYGEHSHENKDCDKAEDNVTENNFESNSVDLNIIVAENNEEGSETVTTTNNISEQKSAHNGNVSDEEKNEYNDLSDTNHLDDKIPCKENEKVEEEYINSSNVDNDQSLNNTNDNTSMKGNTIKRKSVLPFKIRFNKKFKYSQGKLCPICSIYINSNANYEAHMLSHVQQEKPVIKLYRFRLPNHLKITNENCDKYLKPRTITDAFAMEEMRNLVGKYSPKAAETFWKETDVDKTMTDLEDTILSQNITIETEENSNKTESNPTNVKKNSQDENETTHKIDEIAQTMEVDMTETEDEQLQNKVSEDNEELRDDNVESQIEEESNSENIENSEKIENENKFKAVSISSRHNIELMNAVINEIIDDDSVDTGSTDIIEGSQLMITSRDDDSDCTDIIEENNFINHCKISEPCDDLTTIEGNSDEIQKSNEPIDEEFESDDSEDMSTGFVNENSPVLGVKNNDLDDEDSKAEFKLTGDSENSDECKSNEENKLVKTQQSNDIKKEASEESDSSEIDSEDETPSNKKVGNLKLKQEDESDLENAKECARCSKKVNNMDKIRDKNKAGDGELKMEESESSNSSDNETEHCNKGDIKLVTLKKEEKESSDGLEEEEVECDSTTDNGKNEDILENKSNTENVKHQETKAINRDKSNENILNANVTGDEAEKIENEILEENTKSSNPKKIDCEKENDSNLEKNKENDENNRNSQISSTLDDEIEPKNNTVDDLSKDVNLETENSSEFTNNENNSKNTSSDIDDSDMVSILTNIENALENYCEIRESDIVKKVNLQMTDIDLINILSSDDSESPSNRKRKRRESVDCKEESQRKRVRFSTEKSVKNDDNSVCIENIEFDEEDGQK